MPIIPSFTPSAAEEKPYSTGISFTSAIDKTVKMFFLIATIVRRCKEDERRPSVKYIAPHRKHFIGVLLGRRAAPSRLHQSVILQR